MAVGVLARCWSLCQGSQPPGLGCFEGPLPRRVCCCQQLESPLFVSLCSLTVHHGATRPQCSVRAVGAFWFPKQMGVPCFGERIGSFPGCVFGVPPGSSDSTQSSAGVSAVGGERWLPSPGTQSQPWRFVGSLRCRGTESRSRHWLIAVLANGRAVVEGRQGTVPVDAQHGPCQEAQSHSAQPAAVSGAQGEQGQ